MIGWVLLGIMVVVVVSIAIWMIAIYNKLVGLKF
ncbi:unnamed protein product, partial [marine sediment metagenome]